MPRYIDADTLIQKIDGWRESIAETYGINDEYVKVLGDVLDIIEDAPTEDVVEVVRCKDCKHWKDSDGIYRRGFDAESKCPLNLKEVYEGTFYCGKAEMREENENAEIC